MGGRGPEAGAAKSYDAFLSYCHEDLEAARAIQRGLHRFAKPIWRIRALRVFRDETNLAANPEFWLELERAMLHSRFLIVLLSPAVARSQWVAREIKAWTDSGRDDSVRLVLVDGELVWDDTTGTFDPTRSDAVSPALVQPADPTRNPPLYVDLRELSPAQMDLREPQFRAAILDLAADLHGRSKEELDGEDLRDQRKLRRYRRLAVGGLVALTIAALGAASFAVIQARRATTEEERATAEAEEARRQQAVAESRELAARSTAAEDPAAALLLAIAAEQRTPEPTLESRVAYAVAVEAYRSTTLQQLGEPAAVGTIGTFRTFDYSAAAGLVAVGGTNTVQLRDANTWEPDGNALSTRTEEVRAVALSPDGTFLAVGGVGPLTLWDVATRQLVAGPFDVGDISTIAWSPAGDRFLTGSAHGSDSEGFDEIRVWARPRWAEGPESRRFPVALTALSWSPDGRAVAFGAEDGAISVLDPETLEPTGAVIQAHAARIRDLAWSPDGRAIATVSDDGSARLWRAGDQLQWGRALYEGEDIGADAFVTWSGDGAVLVTAGDLFGRVQLWDPATALRLGDPIFAHPGIGGIDAMITIPGGRELVTSGGGQLRRWVVRGRGGGLGGPLVRDGAGTWDVEWSQGREAVLTANGAGRVRSFTPGSGTEDVYSSDSLGLVVAVAWTDGGQGFVAATQSGQLSRWPPGAASPVWTTDVSVAFGTVPPATVPSTTVPSTAVSPTTVSPTTRGPTFLPPNTPVRVINDLVVREAQDEVILAGADGSIMIRRLSDGAAVGDPLLAWRWVGDTRRTPSVLDLSDSAFGVVDLALSPDGARLASAAAGDTVRIWDLDRRETVDVVDIDASAIAWSPDGVVLAIGSTNGTLRWFDTRSSVLLGEAVTAHGQRITDAEFNEDGDLLATSSEDGTVRYWDPVTRAAIGAPLPLQQGLPTDLAWSPDGQSLAVAIASGGVQLWESLPEEAACELATEALGDERTQEILGDVTVPCNRGANAPAVPLLPAD